MSNITIKTMVLLNIGFGYGWTYNNNKTTINKHQTITLIEVLYF